MSRSIRRGRFFAPLWIALAVPCTASAQQNLSFEAADSSGALPAGWRVGRAEGDGRVAIALDDEFAHDGARSLRIGRDEGNGIIRVAQRIPLAAREARGGGIHRVELSGHVRATSAARESAVLWLRVDGPRGFLAIASGSGQAVAETAGGWTRYTLQAPLFDDADEIVIGAMLRGPGSAWFDAFDVRLVDARDLPPPSAAARRYVDAALDVMEAHSLNRRGIDWPSFRADVLAQARGAVDAGDAHLALRYALRNLGDYHSYLVTPQTAASLAATPVSNARTGRAEIDAVGRPLGDGVGYLTVPGFAGGSPADQVRFADRIQSIIKALEPSSTCGWILDLRSNGGGNLWPMLAGVGPLLGDGEIGASVYPDGSRKTFWYREGRAGFGDYVQLRVSGEPHRLGMRAAPVAVLIGPETASAAEVLAIGFAGREHASSFGAATRGLSSGNRTFPLTDGAALVLTVAATADRNGHTYTGPIEPDRAAGAGAAAIDAAMTWLRQHPGCSGTAAPSSS
jgi:hypothetical protein